MYIVCIALLYVAALMAATEASLVAGILTFAFYGLLPIAILVWLFGAPTRRRRLRGEGDERPLRGEGDHPVRGRDRQDAQPD